MPTATCTDTVQLRNPDIGLKRRLQGYQFCTHDIPGSLLSLFCSQILRAMRDKQHACPDACRLLHLMELGLSIGASCLSAKYTALAHAFHLGLTPSVARTSNCSIELHNRAVGFRENRLWVAPLCVGTPR